jgi:hypothetical protein
MCLVSEGEVCGAGLARVDGVKGFLREACSASEKSVWRRKSICRAEQVYQAVSPMCQQEHMDCGQTIRTWFIVGMKH